MEEAEKETVIIVHGTYAAPKLGVRRWYQPAEGVPATEGFITKLNDALQKRGSAARCWAHCGQGDQGFHWSGDGGNVVIEALPQITAPLPSNAPLGKIVTLGTPFMDTMSPVLQRITRKSSFLTGLSWIALIWLILSLPIGWILTRAFPFSELSTTGVVLSTVGIFVTIALVFRVASVSP